MFGFGHIIDPAIDYAVKYYNDQNSEGNSPQNLNVHGGDGFAKLNILEQLEFNEDTPLFTKTSDSELTLSRACKIECILSLYMFNPSFYSWQKIGAQFRRGSVNFGAMATSTMSYRIGGYYHSHLYLRDTFYVGENETISPIVFGTGQPGDTYLTEPMSSYFECRLLSEAT